ncbi:trk system potassium uptake protein TrkA [Halovenus aranensis]|jgi:trk system potassium uptake protein TrkA|uniref:Trk system potassium uptake protein TrkA n=1 Tax=Halovenus aranensis TaxID=890420 RepID=A0A1G8TKH6_9EURY|nr:TrkA family potassium uptake protein [Halovenus aranensis]SDJ42076.1 trk system potassium uptake protein TrkA [Halovenus aranensis]
MRFVIVGAGRVGLRTARAVRESGHDVIIVEQDVEKAERAREDDFEVTEGDGALEGTLEAAGIEDADALGALTGDLNTNFAACTIANHFGCRTVMRIDEDYREDIYRTYVDEVDEVIYPERLGAIVAKNALVGGNIRAIADIEQNLQLVEFTINDTAPMHGYSLSELELPGKATLLAIGTNGEALRVPTPDDTLDAGTQLVILSDSENMDNVRSIIVGEDTTTARGGA